MSTGDPLLLDTYTGFEALLTVVGSVGLVVESAAGQDMYVLFSAVSNGEVLSRSALGSLYACFFFILFPELSPKKESIEIE